MVVAENNKSGKVTLVLLIVLVMERLVFLVNENRTGGSSGWTMPSSLDKESIEKKKKKEKNTVAVRGGRQQQKNNVMNTDTWPDEDDAQQQNQTMTTTFFDDVTNYRVNYIPQKLRAGDDLYSGMWWQPISSMLQVNYSVVTNLEGISFRSFRVNNKHLATEDWLDMNVEHISKYVKYFQRWWATTGSNEDSSSSNTTITTIRARVQQRVADIVELYVNTTSLVSHHHIHMETIHSAAQNTIALLPLFVSSTSSDYYYNLLCLQTASTVASLWNVGIARVLIVGVSNNERQAYDRIQQLLEPHINNKQHDSNKLLFELVFVEIGGKEYNVTAQEMKNVPKLANVQFSRVYTMYKNKKNISSSSSSSDESSFDEENNKLIKIWLGNNDDPSRWKYIYFSEPDLILHIRPEAMNDLSRKLEDGHLLGAHRLNLMPHMDQFQDIYDDIGSSSTTTTTDDDETMRRLMETQLLPNLASFGAIHTLDERQTTTINNRNDDYFDDVCCDQGGFYPSNINEPSELVRVRKIKCPSDWMYCGFAKMRRKSFESLNSTTTWSDYVENHHLLAWYPLISLRSGTGLPTVHDHQRVCVPKKKKKCGG